MIGQYLNDVVVKELITFLLVFNNSEMQNFEREQNQLQAYMMHYKIMLNN